MSSLLTRALAELSSVCACRAEMAPSLFADAGYRLTCAMAQGVIPPEEVAEIVFDAMEQQHLYILTHPLQSEFIINGRAQSILDRVVAARPTPERMKEMMVAMRADAEAKANL